MADEVGKQQPPARDAFQAQHARGAELITAAFRLSRDTGRSDWQRMTTAVLKNRILDLTAKAFDESAWNARTFQGFVTQFPELVSLDASTRPPTVELTDPQVASPPADGMTHLLPDDPARRIRRDLWNAVLDYASGSAYVLREGRAIAVAPQELTNADELWLPTIEPEVLDAWRAEFHDQLAPDDLAPADVLQLRAWRDDRGSDRMLPGAVRRTWNARLKQHVLERLQRWYEARGLQLPADVVESVSPTPRPREADPTEQLRQLVQRCVATMTRAELEDLRLPPAAILRSAR